MYTPPRVRPGLLDLREGEWKAVGPALLLAFLAIGALTLATISADTIFVSAFDLGRLPGLYIATAVARVAVSFAYAALVERSRGTRADASLLAVTAGLFLVSGALVPFSPNALLYPICLALLTLPTLLPLVAMNAAMECFHARQAKRLLPLVAAAATLGAITVGGLAKVLAVTTGTGGLLILAALICAAAVPLPSRLAARALDALHERGAPEAGRDGSPAGVASVGEGPRLLAALVDSVRDVREVPVVRIYVINAFLCAATLTLVDFGFKSALKARFERDEMAAYLGGFNLVSEGVVLVAQLFLTSRLLSRFGILAALESRPAALVLLSPLAAATGVGANSVVKFGEVTLRMAVIGAVSDLLLLPSPARVRTRFKLFAKSAATPLGALAAGIALAPFGELGPPRHVLAVMLGMGSVLSVLALLGVRWAYAGALAEALGEGRVTLDVSPATAELIHGQLRGVLADAVRSSDARRAVPLLSLMSDRLFTLEDLRPAFAAGASGEIGRAAVQAALRLARPGDGATLLAMVPPGEDDEIERDVLAAARGLGAIADRARLDWALARAGTREGASAAGLWAEALTCLARAEAGHLREAAPQGGDGPRLAAPRRGHPRARRISKRSAAPEVEVLRALGSGDRCRATPRRPRAPPCSSKATGGAHVNGLVAGTSRLGVCTSALGRGAPSPWRARPRWARSSPRSPPRAGRAASAPP